MRYLLLGILIFDPVSSPMTFYYFRVNLSLSTAPALYFDIRQAHIRE